MRFKTVVVWLLATLLWTPGVSALDAPETIAIDVKEFFLSNGMQFLVVERPATPQVACRVAIRAGSALERTGQTGVAHMLEHMMFKGTRNFGTRDLGQDRQLQAQIEAAYQVILSEKRKRNPDSERIRVKQAEMERLRKQVQRIYVPQAFSAQVGRNGAVGVNAFTSRDQTQYTMSVPSDMTEQWFSIVSEQLFEPAWREFYVEKEVILREYAFRYVNNPAGAAWRDLNAAAYTAHPYRNPVIGWKADMQRFNTRDAKDFHNRYYNPSNAVCVLVGDITVAEARRLAGIYFERYPAGERATESVTAEPQQQGTRLNVRYLKGARTPLVRMGFHAAQMGSDDFYALDALTMVLGHGRSARLTANIVNKGRAVDAWAYNPDNRYGGMVIVGGSPNEPDLPPGSAAGDPEGRQAYRAACDALVEMLLAEVEVLKTQPVTARELARIKKMSERNFLDRLRSNEDLASSLATLEVQVGWRYIQSYRQRMSAVTAEQIREVAEKYLLANNRTVVYVIPGGTPETPPQDYTEVRSVGGSRADILDRPTDFVNHSDYPTPAGWQHPLSFERRPEKIAYPPADILRIGDTEVFYLPDDGLPLVDLTLYVKAGAVDLPEGQIGLDHLLSATILRGGTQAHPPEELARILDENAIRLTVSVEEEMTAIHLSVMRQDWQKGLSLLTDILLQPRFDEGILNTARQQMLTALRRQGEDARGVARREWLIWHFKDHPYGRDPLGALETLETITSEDLRHFLATHFVARNMVGAVAGDIDPDRVRTDLKQVFAALPKAPLAARDLAVPDPTPAVLTLIHKPGQVQSHVTLGLPSVVRADPDFWKISLLTQILGGSDSLMYRRLRDDLGMVYSAGFYQTFRWKAGMLVGYIGCKGAQTAEAITETVALMDLLQGEIPEHEFRRKQLDTLNSFVFNVDTPGDLVGVYARYQLRGEPLDTLERIQRQFLDADRGGLRQLAVERLVPRRLQIFVVADKSIRVKSADGQSRTLESDLKALADRLGLPFQEMQLR